MKGGDKKQAKTSDGPDRGKNQGHRAGSYGCETKPAYHLTNIKSSKNQKEKKNETRQRICRLFNTVKG